MDAGSWMLDAGNPKKTSLLDARDRKWYSATARTDPDGDGRERVSRRAPWMSIR